jgi:hypothetical protein
VQFDDNAELDTSQVSDQRGMGGRLAVGGGGLGIVGLIIYFVISQLGGGDALPSGAGFGDVRSDQQVGSSSIGERCRTGADANRESDCRAVAFINSIQSFWSDAFQQTNRDYSEAQTTFFSDAVRTGCGDASSAAGPFYCPADGEVYIDLNFFTELHDRFGAGGGPFVEGYVLAHEYGHHVQNLLGTSEQVKPGTGPKSGSVRLELQADCYAGVWANHAASTPTSSGRPLITGVTQSDVSAALDAASRIGDDYIQRELGGGSVDTTQFTHGSSTQRQKWYTTGYRTGDPSQCNTFRNNDLG